MPYTFFNVRKCLVLSSIDGFANKYLAKESFNLMIFERTFLIMQICDIWYHSWAQLFLTIALIFHPSHFFAQRTLALAHCNINRQRFYYSYPCSNALYFSAVRIFGLQRRQAPLIKTWWPLFHSKHRPHLGLYTFGEKASTNNLTTTHYDDKNQGQSFIICNHKTLELLSW